MRKLPVFVAVLAFFGGAALVSSTGIAGEPTLIWGDEVTEATHEEAAVTADSGVDTAHDTGRDTGPTDTIDTVYTDSADTDVVDSGVVDSGVVDGDGTNANSCAGKSVGDKCGGGKHRGAGTGPDGVYYPGGWCEECAGTFANPRVLNCTTFSLATCSY